MHKDLIVKMFMPVNVFINENRMKHIKCKGMTYPCSVMWHSHLNKMMFWKWFLMKDNTCDMLSEKATYTKIRPYFLNKHTLLC